MKRLILSTIIILGAAVSFANAADNFSLGKMAFSNRNYEQANVYFVKALTENPNDANCRYYYAQTLTYLKNYNQAKIEYGYVIQLAPDSVAARYSKQSIEYLESIPLANNADKTVSGDNYLVKAIGNDGNLNTWDKNKMPIKVYFDNSTRVRSTYVTAATSALDAIKSASNGMIDFLIVNNPNQADTIVYMKTIDPSAPNKKTEYGHTAIINKDGYIDKANVVLYTLDINYKPLSDNDVYNVAMHEYCHMLGIQGHSDDERDITYASYSPAQNANVRRELSDRDKNTIVALYSIDNNPYSTGANSVNRILGSKEDRLNIKLQQTLDYVTQYPNVDSGYVNVAKAYKEMGKEFEAIQYYRKALLIMPSNDIALLDLANIYAAKNDVKNAEIYYKKLIQVQPKETAAYKNLIILYIKNNRISAAKTTLANLLYRNPTAKDDPQVQAFIQDLRK